MSETTDIREPRVYEIGFHLISNLSLAEITKATEAIEKEITARGGLPIAQGAPELIDLEYTMEKSIDNKRNKFSQAYFGWIKFDVSPHEVNDIKAAVEAIPQVLRMILLSTVREDVTFNFASAAESPAKAKVKLKEVMSQDDAEDDEDVVDEVELDEVTEESAAL